MERNVGKKKNIINKKIYKEQEIGERKMREMDANGTEKVIKKLEWEKGRQERGRRLSVKKEGERTFE